MIILGIETSCDDTCVAVVEDGHRILAGKTMSQHHVHSPYGGVVPELASRTHQENILPLYREVMEASGISLSDVDGIGVTYAPGLIGALLVGVSFAKALSFSNNIPLIGIHHIESHIYASLLENPQIPFPHIALVISGGHTCAYRVDSIGNYSLLGQTLDDAAGEAFDKVGKFLGLSYPGGPAIEKSALEWKGDLVKLPRPCRDKAECCWSFSGLKTAVMNAMKDGNYTVEQMSSSFQIAVVDILVEKTLIAAKKEEVKFITCSGGVAANTFLRKELSERAKKMNIETVFPQKSLCTDNAAMVAGLAFHKLDHVSDYSLNPIASMPLGCKH